MNRVWQSTFGSARIPLLLRGKERSHWRLVVSTIAVAATPCAAQEQSSEASAPPVAQQAEPQSDTTLPVRTDAVPVAEQLTATGARTDENAVRQAGDAFGTVIGREAIGLYSSSGVRGFSPRVAGNVRIDGLYFDPVFMPSDRISGSSVIRVGPTVFGSPFPSPTGIVDLGLRIPGDETAASVLASVDTFGARVLEADLAVEASDALSVGLGAQALQARFGDGTRDFVYEGAGIARIEPLAGMRIVPFVSVAYTPFHEAATIYVPRGETLPPRLPRNFWNGPAWQRTSETELNAGAVIDAELSDAWTLKAGLFRSSIKYYNAYTNLLLDVAPDGSARQEVLVDPPLLFGSTSGEARLTRTWRSEKAVHNLHFAFRGRDALRRFGGEQTVDLGPTTITARSLAPQPPEVFGEQVRDVFRQWTVATGYEGRVADLGELSLGLQRTDYFKSIGLPSANPEITRKQAWLWNANAAINVTRDLAIYGGYVTGLEESGIAPKQAVNRNEALPAIRTRQADLGLRWQLGPMGLIAGVFDVSKPYFNIDPNGVFRELGEVRHRGIEASISGAVLPELTVVGGTVLLDPTVTSGIAGIGERPVGAVLQTYNLNADWRPAALPGMSFDAAVSHQSSQVGTVSNLVRIPAQTFVDLGVRYRFDLAGQGALLRVQVFNLLDFQGFNLFAAGAYQPVFGRSVLAYLTVDF